MLDGTSTLIDSPFAWHVSLWAFENHLGIHTRPSNSSNNVILGARSVVLVLIVQFPPLKGLIGVNDGSHNERMSGNAMPTKLPAMKMTFFRFRDMNELQHPMPKPLLWCTSCGSDPDRFPRAAVHPTTHLHIKEWTSFVHAILYNYTNSLNAMFM